MVLNELKPDTSITDTLRLVIFDLDGTLMNAYPAVSRSVNYVMKHLGCPAISHDRIKRSVGGGDEHLLRLLIGPQKLKKALKIYRAHHIQSLCVDTKLMSGALKIMRFLAARGIKMAVASNRPAKFSRAAIESLNIRKYFDIILCADQVQRPKPAKDIVVAILKRMQFKPSQALFVGDMGIDVLTARRAKVKMIAVATGSNTSAELQALKPYAVVNRVDRICSLWPKDREFLP